MPLPDDLHRVQLHKSEFAAQGGDASDEDYTLRKLEPNEDAPEVAGLFGQEPGEPLDEAVVIWREDGKWKGKDNTYGTVDLLQGGSGGISESQHDAFDKLLHDLDEDFEGVPTRNADGVMTTVVLRDQSDSPDIRTFDNLTVDTDGVITGYRVRQHDGTGSVVETITGSGDADNMQVDKT